MDCIYQEDERNLYVEIEEIEGVWEGRDADEAWCGGMENHYVWKPGRRSNRDEERAWPMRKENAVDEYWGTGKDLRLEFL